MEAIDNTQPARTETMEEAFRRLWWRTIHNEILGSAISVLPATIFYDVAFSFNATQFRALMKVAPMVVIAFLLVDLGVNWWYLTPFRRLSPAAPARERARVYARLHNLPLFSFARVFGPHALTACVAAQAGVLYANAHWNLGMPSRDYWIYWLLNLTLVPIGHAIFEYHANGWAAREALTRLAARFPLPTDSAGVWRVGLAWRLAVFYLLLAISPLLLLATAQYHHVALAAAAGRSLTDVGKIVAGVALLNLLLLILFARDVNQQTRELLGGLEKVERGDFSGRVDLYTPDEFGIITEGINKMTHGLAERQRIRDLFGVYLSPEVSRAILEGRVALEGETRHVSILFCDIRDFTRFSSERSPGEVVGRLNRFFGRMAGAIRAQGGTINKFLGDGFLAVFGAPVDQPDHARRAVAAALQMEQELASLNAELAGRNEPPMEIGIGIDSGEVIAGNVGSRDRLEYTVIGDPVNRSSRIEQLNKSLETRILISERTQRESGMAGGRALPPVTVKGIDEPLLVYSLGSKA
jgi:class 3 adenylate cyclase